MAGPDTFPSLFSQGSLGTLTLKNRLLRAATWDPSLLLDRKMDDDVLDVYRHLAAGGIGGMITGDLPVVPEGFLTDGDADDPADSYQKVRIEGISKLVNAVKAEDPACVVFAQASADVIGYAPSAIPSPYSLERPSALTTRQIEAIIACFVHAIQGLQEEGFDGVELHAAHGGLLSQFLSPYSNRRNDCYGGALEGRVRVVVEILQAARGRTGHFPLLVKMNSTDFIPSGITFDTFPAIAERIQQAGADAIELSGGMWDCLIRPENDLGFPPVPAPESHIELSDKSRQSYFLPAAKKLSLNIPIILTGGNRDPAYLDAIVQEGAVDFIGLCRPLIREPHLPLRWMRGESRRVRCTACNACIYDMWTHVFSGERWVTRCLLDENPGQVPEAKDWLESWVADNCLPGVRPEDFW